MIDGIYELEHEHTEKLPGEFAIDWILIDWCTYDSYRI